MDLESGLGLGVCLAVLAWILYRRRQRRRDPAAYLARRRAALRSNEVLLPVEASTSTSCWGCGQPAQRRVELHLSQSVQLGVAGASGFVKLQAPFCAGHEAALSTPLGARLLRSFAGVIGFAVAAAIMVGGVLAYPTAEPPLRASAALGGVVVGACLYKLLRVVCDQKTPVQLVWLDPASGWCELRFNDRARAERIADELAASGPAV